MNNEESEIDALSDESQSSVCRSNGETYAEAFTPSAESSSIDAFTIPLDKPHLDKPHQAVSPDDSTPKDTIKQSGIQSEVARMPVKRETAKQGVDSQDEKETLSQKYDEIVSFNYNYLKVKKNGLWGLMTSTEELVCEPIYDGIELLNSKYLKVNKNGSWGFMTSTGEVICQPIYEDIESLHLNYMKVKENGRWGIITSTVETICQPIYADIISYDGLHFKVTKFIDTDKKRVLTGKIDKKGNPVHEIIDQSAAGQRIIKCFEKYGLEKNGELVIPFSYDNLKYWGDNKYIARQKNMFGLIDMQNNVLLNFEYTSITPFNDGYSLIRNESSQQMIDRNLKVIKDLPYDLLSNFEKFKIEGKWGVRNSKRKVIVDCYYHHIYSYNGEVIGIINKRRVNLTYRIISSLNK